MPRSLRRWSRWGDAETAQAPLTTGMGEDSVPHTPCGTPRSLPEQESCTMQSVDGDWGHDAPGSEPGAGRQGPRLGGTCNTQITNPEAEGEFPGGAGGGGEDLLHQVKEDRNSPETLQRCTDSQQQRQTRFVWSHVLITVKKKIQVLPLLSCQRPFNYSTN